MVPAPNRQRATALRPRAGAARLPHKTLALLWLLLPGRLAAQDMKTGIDAWARHIAEQSAPKWAGPRVPFPPPSPRPQSLGSIASLQFPLRVHATEGSDPRRLGEVLRAAEAALALLSAAELLFDHGDAGGGGSFERDVYLVADLPRAADAQIDPEVPVSELDAARAFSLVDARLPASELSACTTQGLVEALLFELDPAESARIRRASAAYFTELVTGRLCDERPQVEPDPLLSWLRALSFREDGHRGTFIAAIWHFCRQQTWEGEGLRGSPHFMEAVEHALRLKHESLDQVAGELSSRSALERLDQGSRKMPSWPKLRSSELPARLAPFPALSVLESRYVRVEIESAGRSGHLTVWAQGEHGARWALAATLLDDQGRLERRLSAPVRRVPRSELHIDLGPRTREVIVSLTNLGDGMPTLGPGDAALARSAQLTLELSR